MNTTTHITRSLGMGSVTIDLDAEATGRHASVTIIRQQHGLAEPWSREERWTREFDHEVTRADLEQLATEAMADALGVEA